MAATRIILETQRPSLAAEVRAGLVPFDIDVTTHEELFGLYAMVLAQQPDVVVFDALLPRLALESAARFLRSKREARRVSILLLVSPGEDLPDPGLLATATGADDFLDISAGMPKLARVIERMASAARGVPVMETGETRVPGTQPGRPSILVVDDDASIAQLIKRMLQQDYDVTVAHDGKSALAACASFHFDAIFCDLMMPEVSGADVYRSLHVSNPALAERIVFVTAHHIDAKEAEFFMGLTNNVVHKPFGMRDIRAMAAKIVPPAPKAP